MKNVIILSLAVLFSGALKAQDLKTSKDTLSYAVGILWGQNMKQQGLSDINTDLLARAIGEVLEGKKSLMTPQMANDVLRDFMSREKEAEMKKNKMEGELFLKNNAEKEGVITLESGLQYEVLKKGDGAIPKATDKVKVHYHGTLINGDVFDSSVQRGEPTSFPVTGVIKGWVEALQLMPVGSKWKLFIPSDLAYGERGAGQKIGPGTVLIFEVELLGIE
ncbi:MAG: FKBP-type peptidyl-prolyl cis-trans isomerase [Saprospiraceae bacterium]|jgi:FKBP-type peptidyl-prolyl cis-trans isomerase FklB